MAVAMAMRLRFFSLNLFWVFYSLNLNMDFHHIFGICLTQECPGLIGFQGVSSIASCQTDNQTLLSSPVTASRTITLRILFTLFFITTDYYSENPVLITPSM